MFRNEYKSVSLKLLEKEQLLTNERKRTVYNFHLTFTKHRLSLHSYRQIIVRRLIPTLRNDNRRDKSSKQLVAHLVRSNVCGLQNPDVGAMVSCVDAR